MGTKTLRSPRRAAGVAPFKSDPTIEDAQRDFMEADAEPAWALKPTETVCTDCHLVHKGECF